MTNCFVLSSERHTAPSFLDVVRRDELRVGDGRLFDAVALQAAVSPALLRLRTLPFLLKLYNKNKYA